MKSSPVVAAVVVLVVIAAVVGRGAEAAGKGERTCNPSQLTPCGAGAVRWRVPPACCAVLLAQLGCLCGYARSPNFGSYVNSPYTARLFTVCRVPMPRCAMA